MLEERLAQMEALLRSRDLSDSLPHRHDSISTSQPTITQSPSISGGMLPPIPLVSPATNRRPEQTANPPPYGDLGQRFLDDRVLSGPSLASPASRVRSPWPADSERGLPYTTHEKEQIAISPQKVRDMES